MMDKTGKTIKYKKRQGVIDPENYNEKQGIYLLGNFIRIHVHIWGRAEEYKCD